MRDLPERFRLVGLHQGFVSAMTFWRPLYRGEPGSVGVDLQNPKRSAGPPSFLSLAVGKKNCHWVSKKHHYTEKKTLLNWVDKKCKIIIINNMSYRNKERRNRKRSVL